jgi:SAM-dependent methyltransferase
MPEEQRFTVDHGARIWESYFRARQVANDWTEEVARRARVDERFLRFADRVFSPNGRSRPRILELGCGTGVNLFQLAERFGGAGVGLDVVPGAHEIHRNFSKLFCAPVRFVQADGERVPFGGGTFDFIFSRGVLEHHKDPHRSLAEQARLLAPGGTLIIGVPQPYNPYTIVKTILMKLDRWKWGWETQYSLSEVVELAAVHGLQWIDSDGDGYTAGLDLGLGTTRKLAEAWRTDAPFPAARAIAERLTRRFADLERRYPQVIFQEVLVAFRKKSR